MSADFAQSAISEDLKFESVDACFGSTTKCRRLSMSEEVRVGGLYGDETDKLEELDTRPKAEGGKNMSAQARRVAAVLASRSDADISGWLARLGSSLARESTLDPETITDVVSRGRPRWGARSSEDAAAYLAFWSDLVRQHPHPRLAAAYSDVLHLLGGRERACEALRVFLDAVRRDPPVFVEYSGDFSEVATQCGPDAELDFELATVAYYAHRVDEGEMDVETLQDAVNALLARHGDDPAVRARLFEIARGSSGVITR